MLPLRLFIVFTTLALTSHSLAHPNSNPLLETYKTTHVLGGNPDTRVQISVKYNIIKNYRLYLGYTQYMFWALSKPSRPFTDQNFNPELFYRHQLHQESLFESIDFGLEHLSNGQDAADSRSVNRAYALFRTRPLPLLFLNRAQLKLRTLLRDDEDNPDYYKFHGPVVFSFSFGNAHLNPERLSEITFEYYNGGRFADDFSKNSFRISLRLHLGDKEFQPSLYAQYFNGYGERLIDYQKKTDSFRIGISFGGRD